MIRVCAPETDMTGRMDVGTLEVGRKIRMLDKRKEVGPPCPTCSEVLES